MFWLKKFVSFWLMPLPFCLALLVAGLALSRRPGRTRTGRSLIAAATALLLLFGNKTVSRWLLHPLEAEYPPIPEIAAGAPPPASIAACRYIAVLGGGNSNDVGMPASSQLSTSALARIVEAVRLARILPDATLIVSGPAEPGRRSHASVLTHAAKSLGIAASRIVLIDTARDTEDEAAAVRAIAGQAPVALVTSAWHMPRAAILFRQAGVAFVACPADFVARVDPSFNWDDLLWDSESLERSTLAVHERIGALWLRVRGALQAGQTEGRTTRKVAPTPVLLSTRTSPPCAWTTCFTMASPSPVPPCSRERALSAR